MTTPSPEASVAAFDDAALFTFNAARAIHGLPPVTEIPKPTTLTVVR